MWKERRRRREEGRRRSKLVIQSLFIHISDEYVIPSLIHSLIMYTTN
jgi:hypothetical protein